MFQPERLLLIQWLRARPLESECFDPPPPLVVPWVIKILGPYFDIVVDAMSPKTYFTLEKNR